MASIFKKRILKDRLDQFSIPNMEAKLAILQKWHQAYKDGYLEKKGEKEAEQEFIQQIFVEVLEHTRFPDNPYTIIPQGKTMTSGQKPDAILGYFENDKEPEKLAAVCEIKDCNTPLDRSQKREGNLSPIQQAFKYKTQYQSCDFVIATNFIEIRLLKDNELNFEKWSLESLVDPSNDYFEFKKFYYLLCKKNLISSRGKSVTLQLLSDIQIEQEAITKEFYKLYKELRQKLIRNILEKNGTGVTKANFYSLIVEKAQKIIDRIVFVAFCEDLGLLPENILQKVVESDNQSFGSTWNTLKGFFTAVDIGSTKLGNADGYNGELFKPDADLDKLIIDDEICHEFLKIGLYDFSEDLSVNILGHIFEQSISDLEKLKSIGEEEATDSTSKRKKDGIFYTPEYIVDYIVQNSVGAWLKEKERDILEKHGVKEELEDKNYKKRYREAYEEYQIVLQNIKVLDPACGSGAFLVKVFDFLLEENKRVSDIVGNIFGLEEFFRSILQNNIYGVDLNPESVEITKLSLWLKTAQKGKKLTTLKNNIKCGNSLIDDPTVAGDRAFKWDDEFKDIMDAGGFDVVVGNPPYINSKLIQYHEKQYYWKQYNKVLMMDLDLYEIFTFHSIGNLLKEKGYLGFITPNSYFTNKSFELFRKYLLESTTIKNIVDFPYRFFPFKEVNTETAILIIQNHPSNELINVNIFEKERKDELPIQMHKPHKISLPLLKNNNSFFINTDLLCKKILGLKTIDFKKAFKLSNPSSLDRKIRYPKTSKQSYDRCVFTQADIINDPELHQISKPAIEGENILQYLIHGEKKYTNIIAISGKAISQKTLSLMERPKLVGQRITGQAKKRLVFTYDETGLITMPSVNIINCTNSTNEKERLLGLLPILNSTLLNYLYKTIFGESNTNITSDALNVLPIPILSTSDNFLLVECSNRALYLHASQDQVLKSISNLIKSNFDIHITANMLEGSWKLEFKDFLKKLKLDKISLTKKDDLLQLWNKYVPELQELDAEIQKLDQEIDEIIFDLYELTPEERQIVLESTAA